PVFCFFLNGLSYIAVIWGLLLIKTPGLAVRRNRRNILQEIREGIQYIKQNDTLVYNVYCMAVVCTIALNTDVLIPVFTKSVLGKGATGYTLLMSAIGIGSLLAALILATVSKKGLRTNRLLLSGLGIAILQIITSFTRNYEICLVLAAGMGFAHLAFINTGNAIFQLNSTDEYRGRVMSVYAFLNQGSTPIGNFLAGITMEQFGGSTGFLFCGLTTFLFLIIPFFILKKRALQ
ncbi:MAG TPA: MFS transporter, partial [Bacillota bacterium]|nr:MFS transporter [Bacillota bacterium]